MALLLLVSCAAAEAVDTKTADPYIELSTQYPAMTVKAGDSLTFALSLDNYSGASQDLPYRWRKSRRVGGLLQRQQQPGERGPCEK